VGGAEGGGEVSAKNRGERGDSLEVVDKSLRKKKRGTWGGGLITPNQTMR